MPEWAVLPPGFGGYVQFDVQQGNPAANLAAVEAGIALLSPEPGSVVVLPELWATGFDYGRLEAAAEESLAMHAELTALAARHDLLIAGSMVEEERQEGRPVYYNTLRIFQSTGLAGSYRKQRLFAPMAEDWHFTAGAPPAPIATRHGLIASAICFDLRFPELIRFQAGAGANLLVVSAQWPAARRGHWRTLLQARAIENQFFVVACNRCGRTGDTEFAGHSMIIAPDGEILAEAGTEPGTVAVRLDPSRLREVRGRFNTVAARPHPFPDAGKVMGLGECLALLAPARAAGRQVVFTNGCFDLLHPGHVGYLEEARRLGDCLVVGLNSDASVRAIKGPGRPVNDEASRARVLAALGCVDHVVLFDDPTPIRLIETILPDILVKGADWPVERIVGAPEVLAAGGRVVNVPLVGTHSTTGIIERIRCQG